MSYIQEENNILSMLEEYKEDRIIKYNLRVTPTLTSDEVIGVSMSNLKKIAKKIDINITLSDNTFEEIILQGLIISRYKDIEVVFNMLDNYLYKINNWAVCDVLTASLKITIDNEYKMLEYLKSKIINEVYHQRFVIVMLLRYYVKAQYIDEIFSILRRIDNEDYYVKMAIAWLLCEIYISYPVVVDEYLAKCEDSFIVMKTKSKIRESYRV